MLRISTTFRLRLDGNTQNPLDENFPLKFFGSDRARFPGYRSPWGREFRPRLPLRAPPGRLDHPDAASQERAAPGSHCRWARRAAGPRDQRDPGLQCRDRTGRHLHPAAGPQLRAERQPDFAPGPIRRRGTGVADCQVSRRFPPVPSVGSARPR